MLDFLTILEKKTMLKALINGNGKKSRKIINKNNYIYIFFSKSYNYFKYSLEIMFSEYYLTKFIQVTRHFVVFLQYTFLKNYSLFPSLNMLCRKYSLQEELSWIVLTAQGDEFVPRSNSKSWNLLKGSWNLSYLAEKKNK